MDIVFVRIRFLTEVNVIFNLVEGGNATFRLQSASNDLLVIWTDTGGSSEHITACSSRTMREEEDTPKHSNSHTKVRFKAYFMVFTNTLLHFYEKKETWMRASR